jgi:hypothetical protein
MGISTRKLNEHLNQALSHGKVTQGQLTAILNGTGFSAQTAPVEVRQALAKALRANMDKFEPAAQRSLDAFINPSGSELVNDGLQASASNPAGMLNYQAYTQYGPSYGKVFLKGARAGDLKQGAAGDCYFDCAMVSLAYTHPEQLKKMITSNSDGTVTVTFHQRNADGSLSNVPITVDRSLPHWTEAMGDAAGKQAYVTAAKSDELWPALVEKAFAQWKGSYEAIGEGGWPAEALAAVTGQQVTTLDTTQTTPDDLFAQITAATQSKQPTVCYTYPNAGHEADFAATGTTVQSDGSLLSGVVDSHAYSIFGTSTQDGQRFVTLRNPWGMHEPGSDGRDDGVFKLPLEQFMKLYPSVSFTAPNFAPPPAPICG